MKKQLFPVIAFLVILFIAGGFAALFQGLEVLAQTFIQFFPFFVPALKQTFEDYFTSAYFIVGVIVFVLSLLGIILSVKEKKVLYAIISGILNAISLISFFSNMAACV